jgi:hypothetical protein
VLQVIGHTQGCKVCPHDPDALASALEEALQHTEPTTGRTDIAHLDRSVVAKQVIGVYEHILNQRNPNGEKKVHLITTANAEALDHPLVRY